MDRNVAAHHLTETAGERETQAGSAELARGRRVCLRKGLEQSDDLLRTQPDAGIGHPKDDPFASVHHLPLDRNVHLAAVRELRRVRDEIEEPLPHLAQIGAHDADVGCTDDVEGVAVLGHLRGDRRLHLADERANVEILQMQLHLAGLDLRKIEDVVDEKEKVFAGDRDLLQIGAEILEVSLDRFFLKHLREAEDGVERRAELMTHVGQEQALRPVCVFGRFPRLRHLGLGASSLRHIFHGQNQELPVTTLTQSSCVQQHHPAADEREVVLELEVVEDRALRNDVFEQCAQCGNVPLTVAKLVDQPVLGLVRCDVKRLVEGTIRGVNAETAVEDQQRLANGVHHVLGVGFDLFDQKWIVNRGLRPGELRTDRFGHGSPPGLSTGRDR